MVRDLKWAAVQRDPTYLGAKPALAGRVYSIRGTDERGWQAYFGEDKVGRKRTLQSDAQQEANQHLAKLIGKFLLPEGDTETRSQAIREFCKAAGVKASVEAANLPDDVKRFRASAAIRAGNSGEEG